jgi:hypothetical protein
MPVNTDGKIDGIMPTGPLKTGYVGYRDFFPDMPAFGTEYDADRMSTVFDPSGSFQSDRDIVNMLAAAYPNESAEQIADRLQSLTANTAMARQFGGAAPDPYSQLTATATPPAAQTDESLLGSILGGAKGVATTAVDAAKSAADTLLNQIKEILPFYDQAQIVLNPRTGTGNIVFGTPPAGQPVIQAGNLPGSNTNVGITTGISILDQAINSVLGREGGLKSGSIRDEVIKIISEQTGASPAATAGILGEDLDTILSTANVKAAEAATRLGVDLTGGTKDVVRDGGTGVVRNGGTGATTGATTGTVAVPDTRTPGTVDVLDTRTPGTVDVLDGLVPRTLTPADLNETPGTVKATPSTVGTGGTGGGAATTPATPAPSQGMRMESTEKAGLADINSTFDLDSTFMENLMRALSGKDDTESEVSYYSGGKVAPYAGVDEIIRLLRG